MQTKLKICSICGRLSKLWRSIPPVGYCCKAVLFKPIPKHKPLRQSDEEPARPFKVYRGKKLTAEQKEQKAKVNEFFDLQADQVPERCENCGAKLNAFSPWAKRGVTAHILPKKDDAFPTVAAHPDNRMFLGWGLISDCGCHGLWDNGDAEYRKKMPCYKLAVERAQSFYDELSPADQVKADKYLGLGVAV